VSILQYIGAAMKIESAAFTHADLNQFLDEFSAHDKDVLADRLEKASARLAELAPRVSKSGAGDGWSAHEVLAHIAVLSKFYGVLVHKISSGQMTELDLLSNVHLRDVMGDQLAGLEPAELLEMAAKDHARTIKLLRSIDARALKQTAKLEDGTLITAEDIARLPLVNHLELHVEQLERALAAWD
jgi:hypothetical protein